MTSWPLRSNYSSMGKMTNFRLKVVVVSSIFLLHFELFIYSGECCQFSNIAKMFSFYLRQILRQGTRRQFLRRGWNEDSQVCNLRKGRWLLLRYFVVKWFGFYLVDIFDMMSLESQSSLGFALETINLFCRVLLDLILSCLSLRSHFSRPVCCRKLALPIGYCFEQSNDLHVRISML